MPPVARTVGLMLALAGPLCLAAETSSRAGTRGEHNSPPHRSRLDAPLQQLLGANATDPGVVQAVCRSPSPPATSATTSEPGDSERSPQNTKPRTPVDPPRILLPPRGGSHQTTDTAATDRLGGIPSLATVAGSLALVLGLFFLVAWTMRRAVPGGSLPLPREVVDVLGQSVLANRAQVHLIRCGNKLLLVSVSPTGIETLTEITDPDEVNRLAGLCRQAQPGSATAAFRQVLQQFAGQRGAAGPFGRSTQDNEPAGAGILRGGGTWEERHG